MRINGKHLTAEQILELVGWKKCLPYAARGISYIHTSGEPMQTSLNMPGPNDLICALERDLQDECFFNDCGECEFCLAMGKHEESRHDWTVDGENDDWY
jgi:hypothetical protein